jgi:hypothetical protein
MLPTTTLGQGFGLEPVYLLGQARPIPSEAMKIIRALHLTAARPAHSVASGHWAGGGRWRSIIQ